MHKKKKKKRLNADIVIKLKVLLQCGDYFSHDEDGYPPKRRELAKAVKDVRETLGL